MKLSILIVNTNQKYFSRMCVEAIEKSRVNFEYEIIVIDNHSTDESIGLLHEMEKAGRIKLVESGGNLGYGKANNLGATHAKGEFVIVSNPDVFVNETTMQTLVDYMEQHPEVGLAGPRLKYYNGETQATCRRYMSFLDLVIKRTPLKRIPVYRRRLKNYLMEDFDHSQSSEVDLITGAYFIMRRAVYNEVGGFDPRYFLFMEDYDLCLKLHLAGYKVVYHPKSEALHYHKRLSDGNIVWLLGRKMFWFHLFSAFKYFWKWKHYSLSKPNYEKRNS